MSTQTPLLTKRYKEILLNVLRSLPSNSSPAEKKAQLRIALKEMVARDRAGLTKQAERIASQLAREKLDLYTTITQQHEEVLLRQALDALA